MLQSERRYPHTCLLRVRRRVLTLHASGGHQGHEGGEHRRGVLKMDPKSETQNGGHRRGW